MGDYIYTGGLEAHRVTDGWTCPPRDCSDLRCIDDILLHWTVKCRFLINRIFLRSLLGNPNLIGTPRTIPRWWVGVVIMRTYGGMVSLSNQLWLLLWVNGWIRGFPQSTDSGYTWSAVGIGEFWVIQYPQYYCIINYSHPDEYWSYRELVSWVVVETALVYWVVAETSPYHILHTISKHHANRDPPMHACPLGVDRHLLGPYPGHRWGLS